jgi:hypothetical protein
MSAFGGKADIAAAAIFHKVSFCESGFETIALPAQRFADLNRIWLKRSKNAAVQYPLRHLRLSFRAFAFGFETLIIASNAVQA